MASVSVVAVGVVAVALLGCGGPLPGEFSCPGAPSMTFDVQPDCEVVARNLRLIPAILKLEGLAPPKGDWPVVVRGARNLYPDEPGPATIGKFDARWGAILSCDGLGLLHELLHAEDWESANLGSAWHLGWEGAKWRAEKTYRDSATPLACP